MQDEIIQDSLKVTETDNGFTVEWDPDDPIWSFLNQYTEDELNALLKEKLDEKIKQWTNESILE